MMLNVETSQLYLFLIASLALLLTPGPAVLYIVARSINQGRMAGIASVLGVETANFFHASAAALGLSAILLSSALAFDIVKYLGAAYLIYLGIRKILAREDQAKTEVGKQESLSRIYSQGFVVNLFNPKTALFFFAFLPQFVNTSNGNITLQIFLLGIIFVVMAIITDSAYAIISSLIANQLNANQNFARNQRYFTGLIYIGLGVVTAFTGSRNK
ncbi:MAG TPA: LysE family translocator [Anaerolineales bacterium]|nr:LysE family translocator [Anaerolineales bacterium]